MTPILFLFTALSCGQNQAANSTEVERKEPGPIQVTAVRGEASIQRVGQEVDADIGTLLEDGDTLKTGPDGFLQIEAGTLAVVTIEADTTLRVNLAEWRDLGRVRVGLDTGTVVSKLRQLVGNESYQVRTNAVVAGVRGTEFTVAVSGGKTKVAVKEGAVALLPPSWSETAVDKVLLDTPKENLPVINEGQELELDPDSLPSDVPAENDLPSDALLERIRTKVLEALSNPAAAQPGADDPLARSSEPSTLRLWTVENPADGTLALVQSLANRFSTATGHRVIVENLSLENMNPQHIKTAGANGPDLLWSVNDHIGTYHGAGLLARLDTDLGLSGDGLDTNALAASKLPGIQGLWALPVSYGNHLMLIYNKKAIAAPPATMEELVLWAQNLPSGNVALAFNPAEPFWFIPWLGAFGGRVFGNDGRTPTLNTPAMIQALGFYQRLIRSTNTVSTGADYEGADRLFREGRAAMIVNGDWSLQGYVQQFGADLGVARLPRIEAGGRWPAPYSGGKYLLATRNAITTTAKASAAAQLFRFLVSEEAQVRTVAEMFRLPSLRSVAARTRLVRDPMMNAVLKGSQSQLEVSVPMPSTVEMQKVWDAMKPILPRVVEGTMTPEEAAAAMQEAVR